jgi:hypothetical protein
MKSHSTFTGRQIGRHVLASLSVIVALAASVSAQSVLGTTGNPLAGGTAVVAGTSPAPNATAGTWKTYKHPVGLSLRYPGDWTLQEVPGFIQLISPEVNKSAQGQPTELYIVSAEKAGRISSLEDPRLISALGSSMTQMFPFLQRVGGMERIKAGNISGIMLTREGTDPRGMKVRGQLSVTILKGFSLSVFAIGSEDVITARQQTVREIFSSFDSWEGERDPQLVGLWQSGLGDEGVSDRSSRYTLGADGTLTKVTRLQIIVDAPGVSLDTEDQTETIRGTWSAGDGRLFVLWGNGSTDDVAYEVRTDSAGSRVAMISGAQGTVGFTRVGP